MDEKIRGALIRMSGCKVMVETDNVELGSYACREKRHKKSSKLKVAAFTEYDASRRKLVLIKLSEVYPHVVKNTHQTFCVNPSISRSSFHVQWEVQTARAMRQCAQ